MNENLIMIIVDIFNQRIEEGLDGYMVIKFSVPLSVLFGLYERLSKVDVPKIETLTVEEKTKYWLIGKKFHQSQADAIKGSKAAYILALITNSN